MVGKWRVSKDHFVDQYANAPDIHAEIVTLPHHDFGRKILWGSTERRGTVGGLVQEFAKPKVDDLNVASAV